MATTTLTQGQLSPANIRSLNDLAADKPLMNALHDLVPDVVFDLLIWAEFVAYLCTMCDHACQCLALSFEDWKETVLS